ncbi:sensor histidine kinase [Gorillibacterium sp. sgz500922]|uniref:sensor histidine kinase n=1 Tax=Gorillibacterium sp. sgz500922 TaxID=3446694 RepID=UPI003F670168
MRRETLYANYFKNNLFLKFTIIVSCIFIVTILVFSSLVMTLITQSAEQRQMDTQRKAMDGVNNYLFHKFQSVQDTIRDVYRDEGLAANATFLLENRFSDYVEYRLDHYLSENQPSPDIVQYYQNKIDDDPDIRSLMLYSANQQILYYYSNRRLNAVPTNASRSFIPDTMNLEENSRVSVPNIWILKSIELQRSPMFSVRVPISNKSTLRNIGQLLVYFDSGSIWQSLNRYEKEFKGTLLVLSSQNEVIFDSSGTRYGQKYLELEGMDSDDKTINGTVVTRLTQSQAGYAVVSLISKKELAETSQSARSTIVVIAAVCILIAVLVPAMFISGFAKRVHRIIRFTHKVKNGDLSARISDSREDELGQIAKSFNAMLDDLNQYIDQVYKAEIKQKHMELATLEARVNPHFLYNTLEVIRMRAVSTGAKDVGSMIYSLSVLFKSFVRPKVRYTFRDELEACRMYLELFRIRYEDRFTYTMECEPELEDKPVLKMSLQPIVENYIVHGMRAGQKDNEIHIRVGRKETFIHAVVHDNGKGIPEAKLGQLRESLADGNGSSGSESFGLRSIDERLKLLYGRPYGIEIDSSEGTGTTVSVTFPCIGEEE